MNLPTLPEPVNEALRVAEKLGVLEVLGEAIVHIVKGDHVKARLSAEEAAIRAAARAPYLAAKQDPP